MKDIESQGAKRADDLLIGAGPIAKFVYGDETRARDVYRNALGLPIFRHGGMLAATKSGLVEAIRSREEAAQRPVRSGISA